MIEITGTVNLKMDFTVRLDMSEAEFDSLSELEQNEAIEDAIDWHSNLQNAETDSIDVWDLDEIKED